jgi:hypothetical protein
MSIHLIKIHHRTTIFSFKIGNFCKRQFFQRADLHMHMHIFIVSEYVSFENQEIACYAFVIFYEHKKRNLFPIILSKPTPPSTPQRLRLERMLIIIT